MQLHDTYFVVGHFHMMIGGVTLLATFGAIYFWFPKMFGRTMNEALGKLHFWFTFAPFFIIFFMQHFLGLQGAPRRYYAFTAFDYLQKTRGQNLVISIAAMVLISGQLLFLVNFVWSLFKGRRADANPWHATTLEWTVAVAAAARQLRRRAGRPALGVRVRRQHGRRRLRDADPAGGGSAWRQCPVRPAAHRRPDDIALREDQVRLGLWMFLATVTMLFAAFTSAYIVRRSGSDWRHVALPPISVAQHARPGREQRGARRSPAGAGSDALAGARARFARHPLGLGFLVGQVGAWRQLVAAGVYLPTNPHSSFFFMLTGAHARARRRGARACWPGAA